MKTSHEPQQKQKDNRAMPSKFQRKRFSAPSLPISQTISLIGDDK